jgi:glutathione peroxidase
MKWSTLLLAGVVAAAVSSAYADEKVPAALNFTMKSITGQDVNLADYKGKVILVVNVASKCGNTKQYAPLEEMHEKLAGKGLAILGFPCNQFGGQEPGSEAEIAQFCTETYKVKFPLFSKIDVNGANAAPFYKYLTAVETKPKGAGDIKWNFEKFVIGRNGEVVARFAPGTSPDSKEVMSVLEAEMAKK